MADFVIAVTGGVASGKSAVCERLAEHGAVVIDADLVSRELVAPTWRPQSMITCVPVQALAIGEQKNRMGAATSAGCTQRPSGTSRGTRASVSAEILAFICGVSTGPGSTAFTRMLSRPSSKAACRTSPSTPDLAAV